MSVEGVDLCFCWEPVTKGYVKKNEEVVLKDYEMKLRCGHVFHKACILPWLEESGACPACRSMIPLRRVPSCRCVFITFLFMTLLYGGAELYYKKAAWEKLCGDLETGMEIEGNILHDTTTLRDYEKNLLFKRLAFIKEGERFSDRPEARIIINEEKMKIPQNIANVFHFQSEMTKAKSGLTEKEELFFRMQCKPKNRKAHQRSRFQGR